MSLCNKVKAKNGVLRPKLAKEGQNAPESGETKAKNMVRYIPGPKLYYRGHATVVYVSVMQFMLLL